MKEGEIIAERYRLDRKLGEGGMGAVWAATHVVTRKRVAIKVLRPELLGNRSLVERFLREARAACAVDHPNVVQIHDVLEMNDHAPVMVMDLLEGESLADRLADVGRIPVPELARILVKVVPAIAAAHAAGVIHRDLKPDNLFLCRTADGSADPRVLDFGIAKLAVTDAESGVLTKTGSMLGTPYYMAPEQLFGEKDIDHRADVWSLGIILYECLSGRRPTEADNLGQIIKIVTTSGIQPLDQVAPHVPPDLCALVAHLLTADRQRRLADLSAVTAAFEPYANANAHSGAVQQSDGRVSAAAGSVPAVSEKLDPYPTTAGESQWASNPPPMRPPMSPGGAAAVIGAICGVLLVIGVVAGTVGLPRYRAWQASKASPPVSSSPASRVIEAAPPPPSASVAPPPLIATATTVDAGGTWYPATGPSGRPKGGSPQAPRVPSSNRPTNSPPASDPPPPKGEGPLVEKPPF